MCATYWIKLFVKYSKYQFVYIMVYVTNKTDCVHGHGEQESFWLNLLFVFNDGFCFFLYFSISYDCSSCSSSSLNLMTE